LPFGLDTSTPPTQVLTAMVTPAVLISACGMLVMSTSNRLARIVDRVRHLSHEMERLSAGSPDEEAALRWQACEAQLDLQVRRGRLIQRALTSFYLALGTFVATTASLGLAALRPGMGAVPPFLGILGTLVLLYGSVILIRETTLALRSIDVEMDVVLQLRERQRQRARR
jgi:threonine/homoserine/homoserine lactone efflux protein